VVNRSAFAAITAAVATHHNLSLFTSTGVVLRNATLRSLREGGEGPVKDSGAPFAIAIPVTDRLMIDD